jgi:hypothetical protein
MDISPENMLIENLDAEELMEFIRDQIADVFDSSTVNYFKKLKKIIYNPDELDNYCIRIMDNIENVYSGIDFDVSDFDVHLDVFTSHVYKFFVKNTASIMNVFLREYIMTPKNRKAAVADYLNSKLPNYPKEQYGKKEYFILMNKLQSIIKDIRREKLELTDFIYYLKRSDDIPDYVNNIEHYLNEGWIVDDGIVTDLFDMFLNSDQYDIIYNKLQMMITTNLINPYLEENGMANMKLPMFEQEDELEDDDEEENNEQPD